MHQRNEGRYWSTRVSNQAMRDIDTYNIPDHAVERFIEQFHELGDYRDPCDDSHVMPILRRDIPDGALRFKPCNPPCLLQLRGFVLLFERKDKQNVMVLAGIFVRNEKTYEETLDSRLMELGIARLERR